MASDSDNNKTDVDDISLEDPQPTRKSGGSLAWLAIVVIIAAVALIAVMAFVKKQQAEEAAQAKADAEQARVVQMGAANQNVRDAVILAEQGNMVAALAKLSAAENLYGNIISTANEVGDQDAATDALARKGDIQQVREALEVEQQRFQEAVKIQLDVLRGRFGIAATTETSTQTETPVDSATPPATEAGAPTTETAPADATAAPPAAEATAPAPPVTEATPAPAAPVAPATPAAPAGGN